MKKASRDNENNAFHGNSWDRVVGFFSPARAIQNIKTRRILERGYAGANNTPSLDRYWLGGGDSNSDIRQDRQRTADRVRQLARDMPWLNGAIEASVAYKVGEGFNMKPAVKSKSGKLLKGENQIIKDAFSRWSEKAELNGRDAFCDIQQLCARQMIECGEALAIHRYDENKRYCLQVYEPDCIKSLSNSANIDQGIEFDQETNRYLKYHLVNTYSTQEAAAVEKTVLADDVLHLYKQFRPWQRRGISPLVQTVLIAADLDEFLSNELSAQQMASRWLAFITDPNDVTSDKPESKVIDNLTIEYLSGGKQVQFAPGADRPTTGVEAFQAIFLRVLSVILHVPYHVISCDYGGLNYNQLREIRNNTLHLLKPDWSYMTRRLIQPTYRRWMDWAVLTGELSLKNYFLPGGREYWQKCFFIPPGLESVDILRDVKGVIEASKAGFYDPQDWIMGQGEDPDEIISGLADFVDKLKSVGLGSSLDVKSDTKLGQAPSDLGTE